jgi:hypothetical protein
MISSSITPADGWSSPDAVGTRGRAVRRFAIGAMLAVLLILGACGEGSGGTESRDPAPADSEPGSPIGPSLDAIVLSESDPPPGTEFLEEITGSSAATHAIEDPEVRAAVLEGFVDGHQRGFITPSLKRAADEGRLDRYARNFDRPGHLVLASWAFAYQDSSSAGAALDAYVRYFQAWWGLEETEALDLGDGGSVLGGAPAYAEGMPAFVYWWRSGSIVLGINANGSVEANADDIEAIAEGMQARADTSG